MKKFLGLSIFGVLLLTGCQGAWNGLSNIGTDQQKVLLRQSADEARAGFVKILADPTATPKDKEVARQFIENIDKSKVVIETATQPGEDWLTTALKIAGAFGVPYAGVASVLWGAASSAAKKNRTAMEQTVAGIQQTHPTGLPPDLKQNLAAAQDTETKELVAEIKTDLKPGV